MLFCVRDDNLRILFYVFWFFSSTMNDAYNGNIEFLLIYSIWSLNIQIKDDHSSTWIVSKKWREYYFIEWTLIWSVDSYKIKYILNKSILTEGQKNTLSKLDSKWGKNGSIIKITITSPTTMHHYWLKLSSNNECNYTLLIQNIF